MSKCPRLPFYLMQRMTAADRSDSWRGFDAHFKLDYMGSAEFEWGAIPDSLKAIRAHRKHVVKSIEVTRGGVTRPVYFVGAREDVDAAAEAFPAWFAEDRPHGKEWTYLPELFAGTASEYQQETNAWWALRANVMLALDADVAQRLLDAIKASKKASAA